MPNGRKLFLSAGGTLQQRINSCLEVLDGFMFCDYPVVASMVVAEKRSGGGVAGNIVDTVVNILGNNLNTAAYSEFIIFIILSMIRGTSAESVTDGNSI